MIIFNKYLPISNLKRKLKMGNFCFLINDTIKKLHDEKANFLHFTCIFFTAYIALNILRCQYFEYFDFTTFLTIQFYPSLNNLMKHILIKKRVV